MHLTWLLLITVTVFESCSSRADPNSVILSKKEALSFHKRFIDDKINEECYNEGCEYEEVKETFGHTEQSYEFWNAYRCNKSSYRCKDAACRGNPIGMENGNIPDKHIKASSRQEPFHAFRPEGGRLNSKNSTWCPNTLGKVDQDYYLQIEFPSRYNICAVATQGSSLHDTDWVKKYRIQTSMDGHNFTFYKENGTIKEFMGNTNTNDIVKQDLNRPVTAHFIRFLLLEWNDKPCMRAEVYGTAIDNSVGYPGNCDVNYVKVGCYSDDNHQLFGQELFQDRDSNGSAYSGNSVKWGDYAIYLKELACRCAKEAQKKSFTYFGLQNYGRCFSAPDASRQYNSSNQCLNGHYLPCDDNAWGECVGKATDKNYVYKISEASSSDGEIGYGYDSANQELKHV